MTSMLLNPRTRLERPLRSPGPRLDPAPRRRPALLIGSVALLAACAAVFGNAYVRAGHQVAVLALVRSVPVGAQVTAADLTAVRIAASGPLDPVLVGDARQVVGRRAAVALVPGTLLTMADVTMAPAVPPGKAIVGIAAKPSQLPAEGVAAGQAVDVVLTGPPGSAGLALGGVPAVSGGGSSSTDTSGSGSVSVTGGVLAADVLVTVSDPGSAATGGTADVSLLVPADLAPVIASASAAGQVALIAVAP